MADKLLVCAALVMLVELNRVHALIAVIIIGREITISALREWMAQIGAHGSVAVHSIGKFKTIAQLVAIPMLLFNERLFGLTTTLSADRSCAFRRSAGAAARPSSPKSAHATRPDRPAHVRLRNTRHAPV